MLGDERTEHEREVSAGVVLLQFRVVQSKDGGEESSRPRGSCHSVLTLVPMHPFPRWALAFPWRRRFCGDEILAGLFFEISRALIFREIKVANRNRSRRRPGAAHAISSISIELSYRSRQLNHGGSEAHKEVCHGEAGHRTTGRSTQKEHPEERVARREKEREQRWRAHKRNVRTTKPIHLYPSSIIAC